MQMGHSSAVGLLALALCLVACVSASAAPKRITVEVIRAVKTSKNSTEELCNKTQSYIDVIKVVLQRVERFKTRAEEVKFEAAQALSQAEKAAKQNAEAKPIVDSIKEFSNTVSTLYKKATEDLKTTEGKLNDVLSQAETLKGECDKVPKKEVLNIKTKVGQLDKLSDAAVVLMKGVDATARDMTQSLTKAQLGNLHVNVIVDVAKVKNMMEKADIAIQETEEKKNKVSVIVQEIRNLKTTAPTGSNEIIEPLYKSANDALTNATDAVTNATNAKDRLTQLNGLTDAALKNITVAKTEKRDVQKEVNFAKAFVRAVERTSLQLQTALQTADDSVTSANDLKQKLATVLSTTTSKPRTEQNTQTAKSGISVGQGTGPGGREAAIQPKGENSEILKDKLSTGEQNVPTTALTGGKAPAPGAKNDSAMTVTVPLLVALIASAVLQ